MKAFTVIFSGIVGLASQCAVQAAESPQQIRITVERLDAGRWKAANAASVFASGDRVRFEITASFSGFLYVMNQGTSGAYDLLFPRSDIGGDNRLEVLKTYLIPEGDAFRVSGPPGQDIVYWLISPIDLGNQYKPLPPPRTGSLPSSLKPRCDDLIFKARGECIDHSAGLKPIAAGETLPDNLKGVGTPREMMFIQDGGLQKEHGQKESVVISSPTPLTGPVVYELRLAHR